MIQFTTGKGEFLAVEVPKQAKEMTILSNSSMPLWYRGADGFGVFNPLPEGNIYAIVGIASQLTDEQWAQVVDYIPRVSEYIDYEFEHHFYPTPLHSGYSLLRHHNIGPNCLIIKIEKS